MNKKSISNTNKETRESKIMNINEEQIVNVPIDRFVSFKNHPFKVSDNEEMKILANSIQEQGRVLVPGIARRLRNGNYELISGHRRCVASKIAGLETMPVIIKNMTDDEATIAMVDSNIHRENLSFSEKAYAYKMKYEALKHKYGKVDIEQLGEQIDESLRQIQRYIRLTELIPELLNMVDKKELGFVSGVELSFISKKEQQMLVELIDEIFIVPNGSQAALIKKYSMAGELNESILQLIMIGEKPKVKKIVLKAEHINKYFSDEYSEEDIEEIIFNLLDIWKKQMTERR